MSAKPKKSRLYLIVYSVALFSTAAAILLLSYLYSSRMENELEESRSISVSAMQSVESLIAENQSLIEQIELLNQSLDSAVNGMANAEERIRELELIIDERESELDRLTGELYELTRLYNKLLRQLEEENND